MEQHKQRSCKLCKKLGFSGLISAASYDDLTAHADLHRRQLRSCVGSFDGDIIRKCFGVNPQLKSVVLDSISGTSTNGNPKRNGSATTTDIPKKKYGLVCGNIIYGHS